MPRRAEREKTAAHRWAICIGEAMARELTDARSCTCASLTLSSAFTRQASEPTSSLAKQDPPLCTPTRTRSGATRGNRCCGAVPRQAWARHDVARSRGIARRGAMPRWCRQLRRCHHVRARAGRSSRPYATRAMATGGRGTAQREPRSAQEVCSASAPLRQSMARPRLQRRRLRQSASSKKRLSARRPALQRRPLHGQRRLRVRGRRRAPRRLRVHRHPPLLRLLSQKRPRRRLLRRQRRPKAQLSRPRSNRASSMPRHGLL
jgi:hypothetical protein